jgi:uncharacterized RDD family membrane protein YckC
MLPEPDSLPSHPGALCARHEQTPAVIICSRCGSYACAECRRREADGLEYCQDCRPTRVLADRGERFTANLIDSFIVAAPVVVALLIHDFVAGVVYSNELFTVPAVLVGLAALAFQAFRVHQTGQSVGKGMMRIRVVRTDGGPVSLGRLIFLRNVAPLFASSFCGFFSLVDALLIFGHERRCLHDVMADTLVVKAED